MPAHHLHLLFLKLSHVQFQRKFDYSEYGNVSIGGNYRSYNPNSKGTIFSDTNGRKLQVSELGFFSGYTKETEKLSMKIKSFLHPKMIME